MIILTVVRLFHRKSFFDRIQDPLPARSCSSLQQLPASIEPYWFVFISVRSCVGLNFKVQLLIGYMLNRLTSNPCFTRYFSYVRLRISGYEILNQLTVSGSFQNPFCVPSRSSPSQPSSLNHLIALVTVG